MHKPPEQLVEDLITLPTIPSTLGRLNAAIEDPDSSAKEIAEVVIVDQSVATKVLRIANSSFYGLRTKVNSLQHSISILGTRILRNLVLQATTMQAYQHLKGNPDFDIEDFWGHSILTAVSAQLLAKHARNLAVKVDDCYAIGLVHDIGRVVLMDCRTADFLDSVRWARTAGASSTESERRTFGFDHTHVGELLVRRWSLSEEMAWGIRLHHSAPSGESPKHLVGCLIHLADRLSHNLKEQGEGKAAVGLDPLALDYLGIPIEKTVEVAQEVASKAMNLEF